MAISDRITSIEEHIKESYQELEGIGIDTTEVDKNLENIPKLIDGYWETLPKVTGEGTSITLDNTKEGKMKIGLKGNTSQETTTGSQLIDFTTLGNANTTNSFINDILTINTSSGTYANAFKNITSIYKSNPSKVLRFDFTSLNSTTDLSGANGYVRLRIVKTDNSVTNVNLVNTDKSISTHTIPSDVSDISSVSLTIYANNTGTTITNTLTINKPILHFGSTSTDYEPYTNGASPNPDYPQDIHVVSGDNSIEVCGKNFATFNLSNVSDGIFNADGTINTYYGNTSGYDSTYYQLILDDSLKCTFTAFNISNDKILVSRCFICYYDKDLTTISRSTPLYDRTINANSNYSITLTPPTNAKYFRISFQHIRDYSDESNYTTINVKQKFNDLLKLQFEKGTSSTTYEAYTGQSYPIDLGVENLFDNSLIDVAGTYQVSYSVSDEKITINSTSSTGVCFCYIKPFLILKPNTTYTLSFNCEGNLNRVRLYDEQAQNYVDITATGTTRKVATFTTNTNTNYRIMVYVDTNKSVKMSDIQVEKNSKANSYTPYGTTPIELCKIGDYQDSIKKSTGKNLFDVSTIQVKKYVGKSTGNIGSSDDWSATDYIEVKENTDYILSGIVNSYSDVAGTVFYNANKERISAINSNVYTFTTPSNAKYVRISLNSETPTNVMFNEGTTALPYEPYGKVWYVNKQIGKVVFNGSEYWGYTAVTQGSLFRNGSLLSDAIIDDTYAPYCNYYKGIPRATMRANNNIICNIGSTFRYLDIVDNRYTNADDFKAWLGTHNPTLYYVLTTPTDTQITDSTLISQLEAVKRSFNGQTNITQTNDDKPFILDVTALKELTE